TANDIAGTEIGGRVGSFDSQSVWLLHGATYNETKVGLTLEYNTTDGHREIIDADAQTRLDEQFGTSASLAPGPLNAGREMLAARIDIQRDDRVFRAGSQARFDVEMGPGVAQALDPRGTYRSDRINADLPQTWKDDSARWTVQSQLSYYYGTQEPT